MKTMGCWRCKALIPMLDEDEWSRVYPMLSAAISSTKTLRQHDGLSLKEAVAAATEDLRAEFQRITGYREGNASAIWHHRISLFGPPCTRCGKPLRTPQARHCAACGSPLID